MTKKQLLQCVSLLYQAGVMDYEYSRNIRRRIKEIKDPPPTEREQKLNKILRSIENG